MKITDLAQQKLWLTDRITRYAFFGYIVSIISKDGGGEYFTYNFTELRILKRMIALSPGYISFRNHKEKRKAYKINQTNFDLRYARVCLVKRIKANQGYFCAAS